MPIDCLRCGGRNQAIPPVRIAWSGPEREKIEAGVCYPCWKEWEAVEVKVINEYRLSFANPEHRAVVKQACLDFFKLA